MSWTQRGGNSVVCHRIRSSGTATTSGPGRLGTNISPDITDLSDYFVTSDGRDLFEVLLKALGESRDSGQPLRIE